jgi:hypothetical protein
MTMVQMSTCVFCVMAPCGLVGRHNRFGGTYCFPALLLNRSEESMFLGNTVIYLHVHMILQHRRSHLYIHRHENLKSHDSRLLWSTCVVIIGRGDQRTQKLVSVTLCLIRLCWARTRTPAVRKCRLISRIDATM